MDKAKTKSERELYDEAQQVYQLKHHPGWRLLRQSLDLWLAEAAKAEDDYLEQDFPARDDILRLSLRRKDRQDLLQELDASFEQARELIDQYNRNQWAESFNQANGRYPELEEYEHNAESNE